MPNGEPTKPINIAEEPLVEIKAMPEQFYFKKVKMPKEERGGGGKSKTPLIIVMGAVVIILMAVAAYLFTQSLTNKEEAPAASTNTNVAANVPVNAPPANVPVNVPANIPPAPVCGNGVCESGESSITCLADCPAPLPEPTAPILSSIDTDQDGLTDVEELLFSTDATKTDTDGDGYSDALELVNLYNPTGLAPQKIEETNLVKIYNNQIYDYSIFYPSLWLTATLDETQREVLFTSATGEIFEVIVDENINNLPLLDWYLLESPETKPSELSDITTKSGLLGKKSPDGLTAYFSSGDKIYAISYGLGSKTELNYESAFEMMIKSFKLSL
ncbi:hypothetical protein KKD80_00875 [Patescibacteria group bacterium]|nr:hypothetical protein [Patescibacteria group bacterium]